MESYQEETITANDNLSKIFFFYEIRYVFSNLSPFITSKEDHAENFDNSVSLQIWDNGGC